MIQKLAIKKVQSVDEIEPATVEIVADLEDGTTARLRMSVFALRTLSEKIRPYVTG